MRIHIYTGQVWATRKGVMRMALKMLDKMIATLDNHILVDGEGQRQFLIKEGVVKEKIAKFLPTDQFVALNLRNSTSQMRCASPNAQSLDLKTMT